MSDRVETSQASNPHRRLLQEIKGIPPETQAVDTVSSLTVGELHSLCSTVVRLETYLKWEANQARLRSFPGHFHRGYNEANTDVRRLVLEGQLETMLRAEGFEPLAEKLADMGVGS